MRRAIFLGEHGADEVALLRACGGRVAGGGGAAAAAVAMLLGHLGGLEQVGGSRVENTSAIRFFRGRYLRRGVGVPFSLVPLGTEREQPRPTTEPPAAKGPRGNETEMRLVVGRFSPFFLYPVIGPRKFGICGWGKNVTFSLRGSNNESNY